MSRAPVSPAISTDPRRAPAAANRSATPREAVVVEAIALEARPHSSELPTPLPHAALSPSARAIAPARALEIEIASPIHTPRFSLRPLVAADRDEFIRVLGVSPHLERFLPLRHPGERDDAVFARHLAMARNSHTSGVAWRRIAVNAQGRIVGGFNLINIERGLAYRADANLWVAGDRLGDRVATECFEAMLDVALSDAPRGLGLHEVHAHVQVDNQATLKLVSRVGLRESGRPPQTLQVGDNWLLHHSFLKSALDRA